MENLQIHSTGHLTELLHNAEVQRIGAIPGSPRRQEEREKIVAISEELARRYSDKAAHFRRWGK